MQLPLPDDLALLVAKGVIVEMESRGFDVFGEDTFALAEEVYRFCDQNHASDNKLIAWVVEQLLRNLSGDSPAIRRAKCHPGVAALK